MNTLPIIDLIAGLIFLYFLLALINNSFVELLFSFFKTRAFNLKNWIIATFENNSFNKYQNYFTTSNNFDTANKLLNHPLLTGTSKSNKSPSYMDSKAFATALVDVINVTAQTGVVDILQNLQSSIENSQLPSNIKDLLITFVKRTQIQKSIDNTVNEITYFEQQIEDWFNNSMERLGGKLKRWSMLITLLFATISTSVLNIDSIGIAKYLYNNPEANAKLANQAFLEANDSTLFNQFNATSSNLTDSARNSIDSMLSDVKQVKLNYEMAKQNLALALPIGWNKTEIDLWHKNTSNKVSKIGGLLMTIFAICLGAPFWFSVLGKIANLRSSVKPGK